MIGLYAKLISGGASLLIQILLVVGGVLLFMFLDPFGITIADKKKLKDTPVQVESIKKLGELITAEYYGEVVTSLEETVDTLEKEQITEFTERTEDLHDMFKAAIKELAEMKGLTKKERYISVFRDSFPQVVGHPQYETYIRYIFEQLNGSEFKQNDLGKGLTEAREKKLLRKLYTDKAGGWRTQLDGINTKQFAKVYQEGLKKTNKKRFRRSRLAMIGRGWVKAGFDFENFNEDNFHYDKDQKTIHFIGFQPKIISATINPWFIPEEGVEGFEFLIAEKGVRMKPEMTKLVKQRCLDKLVGQATRKDILGQSITNAETYLKSFFSLILEDEIKQVVFHANLLEYTLETLLMDSVIRNEELYLIDSTLVSYAREYGSDTSSLKELGTFIAALGKEAIVNDVKVGLNAKTTTLFEICKDRSIDSLDAKTLRSAFSHGKIDSLWHIDLVQMRDKLLQDHITRDRGVIPVLMYQSKQLPKEVSMMAEDSLMKAYSHAFYSDSLVFVAGLKELLKYGGNVSLDTFNHSPYYVPDSTLRKYPDVFLFGKP